MIILETDRLILRHLLMADLEPLFALYQDPEVVRFIPDTPSNLQETQQQIEWHINGHLRYPELGLWATLLKETEEFIGRCGLLPWKIDGQELVEVAFLIAREHWGNGLGTEVAAGIRDYGFGILELPQLVCLIEYENRASIRVAEKIGMAFWKEGEDEIGPFLLYSMTNPQAPEKCE